MKNKRGFTLVELLAVIVILALIALIVTPIMIGVIEDAESGTAETSAGHFIKAVNNEIVRQEMKGNPIEDGEYVLTEDGALCAGPDWKYNSTSKKIECSNPIKIDVSGDNPTAGTVLIVNSLVADGTELTIKKRNVNIINGAGKVGEFGVYKTSQEITNQTSTIKYDPVANAQCTSGSTCYQWYVLEDKGENSAYVSLIMNQNLIVVPGASAPAWISAEDYAKANIDGTTCSAKNGACSDEGPVTAMNWLNLNTSNWSVYTTMPTFLQIYKATIANHDSLRHEVSKNGSGSINLATAPWLYTNLDSDGNTKDIHFAYWTLDAKTSEKDTFKAWDVDITGNPVVMYGRDVSYSNRNGVRPVIKVLKENLK